jgi:hypothetical protein
MGPLVGADGKIEGLALMGHVEGHSRAPEDLFCREPG